MIRRMTTAAVLILTAVTLFVLASVAGIRHTTTAAWRPQPPPVEIVCVDVGLPYKLCYTVRR